MRDVLLERIRLWIEDEESTVEYAEEVEGRWAVRMTQQARDATTVWFDIGERSLSFEAYVLPVPEGSGEAYRQALVRNARGWRTFFALDNEGAIVLRGRLAADVVTIDELDRALGEVYEMIEVAFPALVRAAYSTREKTV